MAGEFDFGFQYQFPEIDWSFGLDPSAFQIPLDFSFPQIPDFNWDFGGFQYDPASFQLPDPLALPSFTSQFQPAFAQQPGGDFGGFGLSPAPGMAAAPMSLADLGFEGTAAPQTALPSVGLPLGADPLVNLQGTDQGLGLQAGLPDYLGGDPFEGLAPSPISTGGYGLPSSPLPGLGGAGYAQPGAQPGATVTGAPMSDVERLALLLKGNQREPSTWDNIAKIAAAFGPTAMGAAGLGLQAANRPERNPLEDDLLRARIASSGQQDTLAKERLDFEKANAQAQLEAQAAMQAALIESRKPGGQGNIDALLKGNPQLAALYQALTKQTTGLASGDSPEFNALIEQIAQVDIAELQRQAQQQIAQAQELAARQGINPANIIAEVQQRLLQESAKARANARQTLITQLGPGINVFNSVGGLFGNLFQTPSA